MGLVARLLGGGRWEDVREQRISRLQATTREQTRRELIAMAVRDTLKRHGLPASCITAEALPGSTTENPRGVHLQLVFRDRQPSLVAYAVALEAAVKSRLQRLDPLSPTWITGVSWRFEPQDRTVWPNLPVPRRPRASAAPARMDDRAQATVALETLLQPGSQAFLAAAGGDAVTTTGFSPTLPMRG